MIVVGCLSCGFLTDVCCFMFVGTATLRMLVYVLLGLPLFSYLLCVCCFVAVVSCSRFVLVSCCGVLFALGCLFLIGGC